MPLSQAGRQTAGVPVAPAQGSRAAGRTCAGSGTCFDGRPHSLLYSSAPEEVTPQGGMENRLSFASETV